MLILLSNLDERIREYKPEVRLDLRCAWYARQGEHEGLTGAERSHLGPKTPSSILRFEFLDRIPCVLLRPTTRDQNISDFNWKA